MNVKTYDEKKRFLQIIVIGLQALALIFCFIGGAISRTGTARSIIYAGKGSSKTVDFSIYGLANTRWDLGGDPQIKYGGAQLWLVLFLILTIASICYIIYELATKKSIIPEKVSSLVIAGTGLYGFIFVMVLGNMSFSQKYNNGETLFLTTLKRTVETKLGAVGIIFAIFCLGIVGFKICEFILTLKNDKVIQAASTEESEDFSSDEKKEETEESVLESETEEENQKDDLVDDNEKTEIEEDSAEESSEENTLE